MDKNKPEQKNAESSFLKDIMSVSGYPGLYRFISQARNGIIVESLEDGKRMQAFSTMKVSALEEIAVYTEKEEVPLGRVLKLIYEKQSGSEGIDPKSNPESLKKYFSEVLPEYNREKVYISDIKKMLSWYNILHKHDLLKFEEAPAEAPAESSEEAPSEEKKKPGTRPKTGKSKTGSSKKSSKK
jgi:hypothetical protein